MKNITVSMFACLILLLGFFATGQYALTGGAVTSRVTVEHLRCAVKENAYEVTADVRWDAPSETSAKVILVGVDNLRTAPEHENAFRYEGVANRDGVYALNVYLYNNGKLIYKDLQHDVSCTRAVAYEPEYRDYVYFFAEPDARGATYAEGDVFIELPGHPESCEFVGKYETKERVQDKHYAADEKRYYCVGATGKFYGFVDESGQRGKEDPDNFFWFGYSKSGAFNPPERSSEGSIIFMRTCDSRYLDSEYFQRDYHVKVKVADFDKRLRLHWEYRDQQNKPKVEFKMNVLCKLRGRTSETPVRKTVIEEPTIELESENMEIAVEDAEPLEAEESPEAFAEVPQVLTPWQKIKRFFGF